MLGFAFAFAFCKLLCCSYGASIIISDESLGRSYDGVGAISGGGATSKLLINYPDVQRSEILDFLFKPNWGASLQILKVEIGGDGQSTEGTESSHMHEEWDENYSRGYEWWLMKEAKKRNPAIKLYGLPWAFPGWIGNGQWWPFKDPHRPANYIVRWILGAKSLGLDIDFIGLWNEKPYDIAYVKVLRNMLNANNLTHVKIVATDMIGVPSWDVVKDMMIDSSFNNSIDVVGGHYTGTWTSEDAKHCGKPLWSSEDYGNLNDETGGGCMARIINQNYINGLMTSTIAWSMLSAYYDGLPSTEHGLMTANEPWSGYYEVRPPIWATAHTTQFTEIGWQYLAHGSGVGKLPKGGTFVTLISPDKQHFTIVIETMNTYDADFCVRIPQAPQSTDHQNVSFVFQHSLSSAKSLHIWKTTFGLGRTSSTYFNYQGLIKVTNNQVALEVEKNSIYTLTTLSTGHKGFYNQTAQSKTFPLPYRDNFESYMAETEAFNVANQVGVFEIKMAAARDHKQVLRQVLLQEPVIWCPLPQLQPITLIGSNNWSDISITVDVYVGSINATSGVHLATRINQAGCWTFEAKGIFFFLHFDSNSFQISTDFARTEVIHTGELALKRDMWYTAALSVHGDHVVAKLDQKTVFEDNIVKQQSSRGFVGFGTTNFGLADFDNLAIDE